MKLLSQIWGTIQGYLFPFLEEEFGPLTDKQKQFVSILEVIQIEKYVKLPSKGVG